MKKKKMRTPLLSLLLLFFSMGILLAECPPNSGPTTPCDPCKARPYKVCVDGKIETQNLVNPSQNNDVQKKILPICINLVKNYDLTVGTEIGGVMYQGKVISIAETENDFNTAANKWNYICGYDASDGNCGTTISARFSDDYKNFKDAYNDPSNANVNDGDNCSPSDTMYLNISQEFEKATPSRGNTNPNPAKIPCYHVLMNDDYIRGNGDDSSEVLTNYDVVASYYGLSGWNSIPYEIYNMIDVVIRQVGEILGLGTSGNGCGFSIMDRESIFPVNESNTVLPYYGLGGPNNESNGDCDKCMFQQLYSPVATYDSSIYEYEPKTQKVYPNPGYNVISIDFTLPNYTENLKMYIQTPLGSIVLVPIENGIFDAGEHTTLINVDSLPTGTYYIIIESDTYRSAKPIMVLNE